MMKFVWKLVQIGQIPIQRCSELTYKLKLSADWKKTYFPCIMFKPFTQNTKVSDLYLLIVTEAQNKKIILKCLKTIL